MVEKAARAVAVVGVGAVLPDAPNADAYWDNLTQGRYSISEVTADRWDPNLYFDPDPKAPDKTYSTIGGWVRDVDWSPLEWRLPIPPKVSDSMDRTQKWSVVASREALLDYGYPDRPLDPDRTAVVLGNAMAGDMHYLTLLRAYFPEYAEELTSAPSFAALPAEAQAAIVEELHAGVRNRFPNITEDTMPGELGNIIAGRVANLFNFHGPNFVVDAACASALAAIDAAIEGLEQGDYDTVLTGGIDANMGVPSFIKFCKIGALSATGTRPYHDGADGFVMGEGAAVLLLKRLADAERDGDHIYAVIRGLGGSSDGKGKGITAPNPVGQEFAISRAWKNAGISPTAATYIEGHGTSTRVGDVVEVESLTRVFSDLGLPPGTIPLGSVKSNIGHLKSSAGAAGMLKAIKSLDTKTIPPSLGGTEGNPNIDFSKSPLYINRELAEWSAGSGQVRSAGVSAFGFGGTNFHVVLEEYIPGRLQVNGDRTFSLVTPEPQPAMVGDELKTPLRGALVVGGADEAAVLARLREVHEKAAAGSAPVPAAPDESDLRAEVRVAIDYGDASELATKTEKAIKALESDNPIMWKPLSNQGVFLGKDKPQLTAFLYTGQGSQYVNMLDTLRHTEPIVRDVFAEADRVMEPILGKPLTDYIFADASDEAAVEQADAQLRQTEITQPAVLAVDHALTKLMAAYGIHPDMVMGHSLGEYGALVAAGALPFEDALHAVAGRGREMANVEVEDNGLMAAVFAPIESIQQVLDAVDGYVVIANINSTKQAVIGGATPAVRIAMDILAKHGAQVVPLPVSHAFHTEIVAPASEPLGRILTRLRLESPAIPLVANIDGEFYPMGPNVVPKMIAILEKQIASPVQFVKGLRTLHDAGCRVFIEMGPKKALQGMADDVLGDDPTVSTLYANHPKQGDVVSFNQALCGMYAAGHGLGIRAQSMAAPVATPRRAPQPTIDTKPTEVATMTPQTGDMYSELGHLFADFLSKGYEIYSGQSPTASAAPFAATPTQPVAPTQPVVVTGAGLGLPGGDRVFGDDKVPAILHGEQFIDTIPVQYRKLIADKHITRLVKSKAGGGHFETIDSQADVIKLAGRGGTLDLVAEFGFPAEREDALDQASKLAIGSGLEALRDAGIPLAMHYKTTTTGSKLPERWMLPEAYRDTTGVIFASAFPGADGMIEEIDRYWEDQVRQRRLDDLRSLQQRLSGADADGPLAQELRHRIHELEADAERNPYLFNRKFLFKAVSMGHAQFAEYIGARGPNTQINAACASTTQAVAIAEDWIGAGRCERVVIISGDDVTSDNLIEWIGSGFLAVGAAATDEVVEEAALPFDRRRHGMILGMGAAALVVESARSAAERGIRPIAQVLSAVTANSAFHGSRLDPSHIKHVMEDLVSRAEQRWGIDRNDIAPRTVFISHETYTPARGGSAQAEVDALRFVFGDRADDVVVSNTKGFTGHAMGVGVEDVVAIKSIETGIVPPVPNFKEVDPDLGNLNLSRGGTYPVEYALRLGAGFGSQISLTLYRYVPSPTGARPQPDQLGFASRIEDDSRWRRWLADATGVRGADVEVAQRTLRVTDNGEAPSTAPAATSSPAAAVAPAMPDVESQIPAAAPTVPDVRTQTSDVRTQMPDVRPQMSDTATAAPAAPAAGGAADPVADRVLALVAEQTGYPADMLALDLDLEADLGIDTVKQAETFAAIRDEYGIERDDSLALRDYPTLNDVIRFVYERAEGLAAPGAAETADGRPQTSEAAIAAPAAGGAADPVADRVLALVAEQTGYPADMLALDLDLEADLGIDTVKQAETFAAIRDEYGIERDDSLALRDYPTLNDVIRFVYERAEGSSAPAAAPETPDVRPQTSDTATAAPAAPAAGGAADPVADRVLALVAEQTGYPADMLDLELDLEADLGIDTVKQAETFAAIRDEYGIERDDSLALRDYPTLNDVIRFVYERAEGLSAPSAAAVLETPDVRPQTSEPALATPAAGGAADPVADRVLALVAEQTGYPPDMLDLELDLEADLGIDTVKQAETFAAIRDEYGIERDDSLALRDYPTLNDVIRFVYERAEGLSAPSAAAVLETPDVRPQTSEAAIAAPAAGGAADPVADRVLAVVAEQTGYPPDMLDLELDLEADLGIDTVKQAETFAAIRDEYGIERDDSLALRDYPTLNDVIRFVYERAEGLSAPSAAAVVETPDVRPQTSEAAIAAPAAGGAADPVAERVLAVVAEQTGYPPDMLDLDADLEADLGIDTVKQAETFAAIRDAYGIERDDSLALRDYPTLNDVIRFVYERAEGLAAPSAAPETPDVRPQMPDAARAAPATPAAAATGPAGVATEPSLLAGDDDAAAAVPRRIPTAVLRPALDLCVGTGVELVEGARVVVMLDGGGVGAALVDRLQKRGVAVLAIDDVPATDDLLGQIDEFVGEAELTGVYWLPALDTEAPIADMTLDDWREALRHRVKLLYSTMRHAYDRGGERGTFLVSATRLGGRHGYDDAGAVAPMGGAVTGFTKAYKREKPDALVKAVDFEPSRKTAALADILIDEALRDPGAVEIGTFGDRRWTVSLVEEPLPGEGGIELGPDSVVVVTGAAGSIVSAITADLAQASGGTFHLLDLVETPDPNDPDVAAFGSDKDALKRTIFERLKETEGRATPAMVDRELAGIERRHAALSAVQAIEAAGGAVHYHSVNLLDGDAVASAVEASLATSGKVDLLLHAGGLEISRLLPDKEPREYDLVFDVKADGWFNLLKALGDAPVGSTVVFSSVAGRFGNNGQTDYSAANDLLCKYTSHFKSSRPDTLGVALDWTAWGDIGMATCGSIPTVMKAAGIDMLPAAAGIPIVRREVTGRKVTGEQVVGLRLGILLDEFHPTGGLDVGGNSHVSGQLGKGKVEVHGVAGFGIYDGFTVTAELNPTEQPFLYDHQIDGTPVLPGVMGMEAFAETAAFLFPDLRVRAVEDVDFLAPFKFYRNEPRRMSVSATFHVDGEEVVAHCRLIGSRTLVGQDEPQRTVHFTGTVRLGPDAPDLGVTEVAPATDEAATPDEIYEIYFHGPAYQVLDAAWGIPGGAAGRLNPDLPPNHLPAERSTTTHPRLAELAFQASGIWEIGTTGTMALPMHVGRLRFAGDPAQADGSVVAMVQAHDDGFDVRIADQSGATFVVMEGYRTVPLPAPVAEDAVAPLRRALGEHS